MSNIKCTLTDNHTEIPIVWISNLIYENITLLGYLPSILINPVIFEFSLPKMCYSTAVKSFESP